MLHREATFLRDLRSSGEVSRRRILHQGSPAAGSHVESMNPNPVPAGLNGKKVIKVIKCALPGCTAGTPTTPIIADMQCNTVFKKVCHALQDPLKHAKTVKKVQKVAHRRRASSCRTVEHSAHRLAVSGPPSVGEQHSAHRCCRSSTVKNGEDSAHRGCLSLPYSMKESTLRIVVAALPPLKGEHSAHRCCRSPGHAGTTLRIGVALLLRHASTTLRIVAAVLPKACRHHSAQSSVYSPLRHAGTTLRRAVYYSLLGMPAPLCAEVYHRRHAGTTLRRGAPTVR